MGVYLVECESCHYQYKATEEEIDNEVVECSKCHCPYYKKIKEI